MATYLERVRAGFEAQRFMRFIGAELGSITEGTCEIRLPFRRELTQQHGFLHGGVVATLADNAGGFAAYSMMAEDEQPLSVDLKLNLLAKAIGDRLVARAKVIKNGRRIKVCYVEVFACSGEHETLCAAALMSVIATRVEMSTTP